MAAIRIETYGDVTEEYAPDPPPFWLLLTMGIVWIVLAFVILPFTYQSVSAITILVGLMLVLAGGAEIGEAFLAPGWKWAHAALGVLFIFGGVFAFAYPDETFGSLALIFGWYLLIKGTFDIVFAFMWKGVDLWWLGLIGGFLEIALAFWAVGYPGRSAALLVLWIGLGALGRGLVTIVAAFRVRSLARGAH
jgi:uncharacterized membrane protein HdeD (DUF308 family)